MQIARTKGRSIEQSDIGKKCGHTDWFVNDIDVDTTKIITNFSFSQDTDYYAWKKLTLQIYICGNIIRYSQNYQIIFEVFAISFKSIHILQKSNNFNGTRTIDTLMYHVDMSITCLRMI